MAQETTSERLTRATSELQQYIADPDMQVLYNEHGPLTIDQLPLATLESAVFQDVLRDVGMPTYENDRDMVPLPLYATAFEFVYSLCLYNERDGSVGLRHLDSSDFFMMLRARPLAAVHPVPPLNTAYDAYGWLPVVHRAHAVAPQFFGNLAMMLDDISARHRCNYTDEDQLLIEILHARDHTIAQAMHVAYRLMGRLIKKNDPEQTAARLSRLSHGSREFLVAPTAIPDDLLRKGFSGVL